MSPATPLLVSGVVRDSNGKFEVNAQLVFSVGNTSSTILSDSKGEYVFDMSNVATAGDTVSISVKNSSETQSLDTTLEATIDPQTLNIDLEVITTPLNATGYGNKVYPLTAGGEVVSEDNPLQVKVEQKFVETRQSYNSDGQAEYIGLSAPGTSDSEAKWQIKKQNYVNKRMTEVKWANRTAEFDKVWDNRTSYNYTY